MVTRAAILNDVLPFMKNVIYGLTLVGMAPILLYPIVAFATVMFLAGGGSQTNMYRYWYAAPVGLIALTYPWLILYLRRLAISQESIWIAIIELLPLLAFVCIWWVEWR
jgi:uncharacterized membrane protein YhaH (DUF805 family)